jgi:hypothetical protein
LLFVVDCGQADGLYAPTSFAVAATVRNYNLEFCHEWSINVQDTLNGVPGVLYGRYPGDTYAGGNPWVLSSSALANLFYRAAAYVSAHGLPSDQAARDAWADVFGEQLPSDAAAAAQVERPTHHSWPNFFNPLPSFLLSCTRTLSVASLTVFYVMFFDWRLAWGSPFSQT